MAALPTLDLAGFRADASSREGFEFVEQLRRACHGPGFCYLTGHGVDGELERALFVAARAFFDLPEPERLEIVNTNSPHFRGYTILGMEHTGGASDRRDQIDLGPDREPLDLGPDDPAYLRVRGPNQWPRAVPEMQSVANQWMRQMHALGDVVLTALSLGLGQGPHWFDEFFGDDAESMVKIIRYPATADPAARQGVGLHNDSGLLTFILQDDVGGLQVQLGDELVDATPVSDTYILNLGELLQITTGGYLRATKHRVLSPLADPARLSVAYFHNPSMTAQLRPVDLPPDLAAQATGGQNPSPDDPVFDTYGENWLKFRLRSHPDVAEKYYADPAATPTMS